MKTSTYILMLIPATLIGGLAWAGWIGQRTENDALPCIPLLLVGVTVLAWMIAPAIRRAVRRLFP